MAEDEAVEQKQNGAGADPTQQAASGSSETPENEGSSGSEDAPTKPAPSRRARRSQKQGPKERVYTLSEVSEQTGISMPTLQRYKKNYQDRIPAVGKGRRQRYPEAAFQVFEEIKQENIKRRGRPKKKKSGGRQRKSGGKSSHLLTLTEVADRTGISYPTLVRYVKLHEDRIPFEGAGRKKRYHPEAVQVFQEIRSESPRGRR